MNLKMAGNYKRDFKYYKCQPLVIYNSSNPCDCSSPAPPALDSTTVPRVLLSDDLLDRALRVNILPNTGIGQLQIFDMGRPGERMVNVNFIMPRDYKKGTDIEIEVEYLIAVQAGTGEGFNFNFDYQLINEGTVIDETSEIKKVENVVLPDNLMPAVIQRTKFSSLIDGSSLVDKTSIFGALYTSPVVNNYDSHIYLSKIYFNYISC